MRYIIGTIIMVWSIFSSASNYPAVTIGEEEDFIDLHFQIDSIDGQTFTVKGILYDKKVGFSIQLLPEWRVQQIEDVDTPLYWGKGRFISTGEDTKNFLLILGNLYGFSIENIEMPSSILADIVSLSGNPQDILNIPCKMKFFFGPDADETLYSEIFINIDAKSKTLDFNEKDIDYRTPLIRSLLGES
jgi:hypothetical protein